MIVNTGLRRFTTRGSGSGANAASLDFDFVNNPSLTGNRGGTVSLTRATTATYTDQDIIVRTALAGQARMQGMRVVRNLSPAPTEDFTNVLWSVTASATKDAANQISFAAGATSGVSTTTAAAGVIASNTFVVSCTVSVASGTQKFRIWIGQQAVADRYSSDITATTTPTRYSFLQQNSASAGNGLMTVGLANESAGGAKTLIVTKFQAEDVTGQSIQTPAEYVSRGVLSTPYHGAGVDGVKYFTTLNGNTVASNVVTEATGAVISSSIRQGFLVEAAATNLCLQSNALTTTWTAVGTPAPTQNVTGPDGATSAWTLTDNSAGAFEAISQNITLTAATYSFSFFVKKTTGAQPSYPVVTSYTGGTNMCACTIDTSNGIATNWTAYTAFTMAAASSATIVSFNADYWRVTMTRTGTAAVYAHDVIPAGTTNPTQSTGVIDATAQGSAVFYGFQEELGSVATSYIPTTTVAVTRNADVATIATGSWYNALAGALYAEWLAPTVVPADSIAASFNDATANNQITNYASSTIQGRFYCAVATVAQADIFANTITPGAVCKLSSVFTANDFAGWVNNSAMNTDATGTLPTVTRLELGAVAGTLYLNSTIKGIKYFPRRLSNIVAQSLTV
jgi:hypothetical protein